MKPAKDSHWNEAVDHPIAGKLEHWGRGLLYRTAAAIFPSSRAGGFALENLRKVLIVKEPYRMGDLLQITPTLRALKTRFPGLFVGLVVQDRNFPLFKNNPHLDRIFVYEKRKFNARPWALWGFLRAIRKENFDLAATLETQRVHLTNDLIALFSGAPFRLRYDGTALGNAESNAFYNLLAPFDGSLHEVERNFGVFKPYGLELRDRRLVLSLREEERERARQNLASTFGRESAAPVLIHPGAYKLNNRWPLENYLEIGRRLSQRGVPVAFTIGPSEQQWEGKIKEGGFKMISRIPLTDMIAVLSLARLVLCNDTGVLHLAAGVGTRTLVLFGNTFPEQWTPPGGFVKVVQAPDKRLSSITLEEVWKELSAQLG